MADAPTSSPVDLESGLPDGSPAPRPADDADLLDDEHAADAGDDGETDASAAQAAPVVVSALTERFEEVLRMVRTRAL